MEKGSIFTLCCCKKDTKLPIFGITPLPPQSQYYVKSHEQQHKINCSQLTLQKFPLIAQQSSDNMPDLSKSHGFVMSLTISQPISRSHELANDFSRFLEKSTSKTFWSCRVHFQVRYQQTASSIQRKRLAVAFDYFLPTYTTCHCHQM